MTTTQGATANEFQQMGENFHGIRIDFEKVSKNLKDFLALRNQPDRDEEVLESWKRTDDVCIVLMSKSHETVIKVDAQISELLKYFDESNPDDSKDILRDSIYDLESFIMNGTRVGVEFSQLRQRLYGFEKIELNWRLQHYQDSLLRFGPGAQPSETIPIDQLFGDTFASLHQRLTAMEHFWSRLKEDGTKLRQKVYMIMTSIEYGSQEFDEMKKDAYPIGLEMHRNIEAYALAVSSPVPARDA